MKKFSKLKKVDLPSKSTTSSLQFKNFIDGKRSPPSQLQQDTIDTTDTYYNTNCNNQVEEDGLTILNDYEFQFANIRDVVPMMTYQQQQQPEMDQDDDEGSSSTSSSDQSLNFQEYSVSYLERDSTIRTVNYKKSTIDEEEIIRQAQSSPNLRATSELDHMIYNLSLEELDFQLRGEGDESLDTKQKQQKENSSFDLEELLSYVREDQRTSTSVIDLQDQDQDEDEEEEFEDGQADEEIETEIDDNELNNDSSMEIDIRLPSEFLQQHQQQTTPLTSQEQEEDEKTAQQHSSAFAKLDGFLSSSPQLPSKIPVRQQQQQQHQYSNDLTRFQIHQDPIKYPVRSSNYTTTPSTTTTAPMVASSLLYQQTLKKSSRLQPQDYYRIQKSPKRICSPKRSSRPSKSAIKIRKNLLNLIVDAASGDQREAAKYGSEINSQNCEGVPLPESTKELVTIPTNNVKETHRAAIIKAISPMALGGGGFNALSNATNINSRSNGFYTENDFHKYLTSKKVVEYNNNKNNNDDKENETMEMPAKKLKKFNEDPERMMVNTMVNSNSTTATTKKAVKWANNLEW